MKILFVILLCIYSLTITADDKVAIKGTTDYVVPPQMSLLEAQMNAVKQAKVEALANRFGSVVSDNTSQVMTNANGESTNDFFSITEEMVRGEWIADIEAPQITMDIRGMQQVMHVTVHGYAREIKSARVNIVTKPLRLGQELRYEGYEYNNGDNIYVYFKSPVDGYVTIYLVDETLTNTKDESVFCLLPYQNSKEGSYYVKHDEEYVFFSPAKERKNPGIVDELVMTASSPLEYNSMMVIFSPNNYSRANTSKSQQQVGDLIVPRSLNFQDFTKWLVKYRNADRDMQVSRIPLTIKKR